MTVVLIFVVFVLPIAALVVWAVYFLIRTAVAHGILDADRVRAARAGVGQTPPTDQG